MKKIFLTQNKFALVDDEDFKQINQYKWFYHLGYAKRGIWDQKKKNNNHQAMHTFIMNHNHYIDHIDGNGLNNQKNNLRICTQSQNLANRMVKNRTGYKGVKKQSTHNSYIARIWVNKKVIHLGSFKTKESAALAYNKAALQNYGEFAKLNQL